VKIILYGTKSCSECNRTKDFFDENEIKFEYIDVGINKEAAMKMIEKTGQRSVPVIEIDGEIILGFDEAKIQEKLGL